MKTINELTIVVRNSTVVFFLGFLMLVTASCVGQLHTSGEGPELKPDKVYCIACRVPVMDQRGALTHVLKMDRLNHFQLASYYGMLDYMKVHMSKDTISGKSFLGNSPLHLSASLKVTAYLAESGADLWCKNDSGLLPIQTIRDSASFLFLFSKMKLQDKDELFSTSILGIGEPALKCLRVELKDLGFSESNGSVLNRSEYVINPPLLLFKAHPYKRRLVTLVLHKYEREQLCPELLF